MSNGETTCGRRRPERDPKSWVGLELEPNDVRLSTVKRRYAERLLRPRVPATPTREQIGSTNANRNVCVTERTLADRIGLVENHPFDL
jgi:hypothetical protein